MSFEHTRVETATMFTLEVIHEEDGSPDDTYVSVVKLHFTNDMMSLTFEPDCFTDIKKVEWKHGFFTARCSTSDFSLDWAGDFIEMVSSTHVGGGALTVRVKATPELTASLKQAFDQWKALF
jgi:hypothetical protein